MPVATVPAAMASLRWLPLIGLLAIAAVAAFWAGRGESVVVLSAVSVLLVLGSLYYVFSRPVEADV